MPGTTPARRLAWIGLFGAPALMLLAVVARLTFPTWLSMGLVVAFVGGFVFLVATMPRATAGDGAAATAPAAVARRSAPRPHPVPPSSQEEHPCT